MFNYCVEGLFIKKDMMMRVDYITVEQGLHCYIILLGRDIIV